MKTVSMLVALLATAPALFARGDDMPTGAHDPRAPQPRPNVCDDKCDVAFMKLYEQCKDEPDCVEKSRKATCLGDYSCSTSCGYTAEGCANPAGWHPTQSAASSSASCTDTTSTVTLVSTIPRLTLIPEHLTGPSVHASDGAIEAAKLLADPTSSDAHDTATTAVDAGPHSTTVVVTVVNSDAVTMTAMPDMGSMPGMAMSMVIADSSVSTTVSSSTGIGISQSGSASTTAVPSSHSAFAMSMNDSSSTSLPVATLGNAPVTVGSSVATGSTTESRITTTTVTSKLSLSTTVADFTQFGSSSQTDSSSAIQTAAGVALRVNGLAILGAIAGIGL